MTDTSSTNQNDLGLCVCGHEYHAVDCFEPGCDCRKYLRAIPMKDEFFKTSPIWRRTK